MTAGLWLDLYRTHYLTVTLCAADASVRQKLVTHLALLPLSCLAMYLVPAVRLAGAVFAGRLRPAVRPAGEALLVTAQIIAAALIMDLPALGFAGDGFPRAWLGMAAPMLGLRGGQCAMQFMTNRFRGNDNGTSFRRT